MKYIEVPLVTRPGIPNSNNVIYDEKILREAFNRRKNHLSKQYPGIPVTDEVAEVTLYQDYNNKYDYSTVDPRHIIGYATELYDGSIKVATNHEDIFNDLINRGYRAGMRYYGKIDYNKADKLCHVTDINNIVCYDMLINYKIVGE